MDKESWLIIVLLIIVESLVLQIYLEFPIGLILSILIGGIIYGGAVKIEKYLGLYKDQAPYK